MTAIFEWKHIVDLRDMDGLGHANNISYFHWMQSAALAHSSACGWSVEAYRDLGQGWVVRSHQIEYLTSALLGDELIVRTWVANFRKVTSLRRYRIQRAKDGVVLANAASDWAFVEYASSTPKRIPSSVIAAFQILPDEDQGKYI